MALVALMIQPLEALYQTSPLRGRSAVAEAVLMMTPLPWCSMIGTTIWVE